ncbi:uncharacterized protein LOC134245839 [Saccostrea cucullata]|uniref:uncharacterized protein LOC134245839 n=1 Tax=Saccostrea cuccullata TaxID=36930 RepID=UPI002ED1EBAC
MKQLDQIEHSLLEDLNTQDKTFDDYITYLNNLAKELHRCLSSTETQKLMSEKKPKIRSIPEDNKTSHTRIYCWSIQQKSIRQTCISDGARGNLVQTDLQGNVIQKIKTSGRDEGYHTVTQDRDLIFTDQDKKVINRITQDNNIPEFIKTGDWRPLSIHSSHINGDLLVGMRKDAEGKVTRYNKTGKELQNIQKITKDKDCSEHHTTSQKTSMEISVHQTLLICQWWW